MVLVGSALHYHGRGTESQKKKGWTATATTIPTASGVSWRVKLLINTMSDK